MDTGCWVDVDAEADDADGDGSPLVVTETKGHCCCCCCCTTAALLQQGGVVDGGGVAGDDVDADGDRDDDGSAARFGLTPDRGVSGLAMLMILVPPALPTGRGLTNHVAIQLLQVHWV